MLLELWVSRPYEVRDSVRFEKYISTFTEDILEDTDMGYELIKGESAHVSKGSPSLN